MVNGSGKKLTDLADEFLLPSNPTHRQYEALRTFFVDRAPSAEAAERFGYTTCRVFSPATDFRQS